MSKPNYEGNAMIANSRYQLLVPTLTDEIQDALVVRLNELVEENKEYCDKGNYDHMCNMLTAMALYEIFQKNGCSKDEAFEIVSKSMWSFVERTTANFYRKYFKIKGALKLMGKLLPFAFKKGSGKGWQYQWHNDTVRYNHLQFECKQCIYATIFKKYNVPELGPMFCHADDINYGSIPNVTFTRNHTLCKDGQDCDFLFTRDD